MLSYSIVQSNIIKKEPCITIQRELSHSRNIYLKKTKFYR